MSVRLLYTLLALVAFANAQAQKLYLDAQVGIGTDFMAAAGVLRFEQNADWGLRAYGGAVAPALFWGAFEGIGFGTDVYKLLSASEIIDTYAGFGVAVANGTGNTDQRTCSFICTYTKGPANAWMGYGLVGARLGFFRFELMPHYRSITVQGGSTESRVGLYTSIGLTFLLNP